MNATRNPTISIVLATHNRRDVTLDTIERVRRCELDGTDYELIVVDNDSTDGTAEAVTDLADRVIRLTGNYGSCAKAFGVDVAQGRLIVFLDDDSSPRLGSLSRLIEHFDADSTLGAAGFRVHLPDGSEECAALPGVFVGCGVGFRAEALRAVGGLDRTFFMQAEEYDLAFRLVNAGWHTNTFDDLHVDHLKTPQARRPERTTFFDTRNNLRIVARYLPREAARLYRKDTLQRYEWLAEDLGHDRAFERGRRAGTWRARAERVPYRKHRLSPDVFEHFFRWSALEQRMRVIAENGVGRVVFVGFGKNLLAFYRAAQLAGINVTAIGDDCFAAPDRLYRDTPVTTVERALAMPHDAVIISNMAPVFADQACARVRPLTTTPVFNWFGRRCTPGNGTFDSTPPSKTSDDIVRT